MKSFLRRLFGNTANPVGYVIQAGQNKVIVKLGCKFAYSFDALVNRTKLLGISEDSIAATGGGVGGKPFSFPQNLHICGNTECLSCSWLYATWGDTGVQAVFQKEKGCYVFVFKHDADGVDSNRKGALVDDVEGKGGAGKSVYFVDIDNPLGAECDAYLLVSDVLDHVDDTQNGSDGGGCDCDHLYPEREFHGYNFTPIGKGESISFLEPVDQSKKDVKEEVFLTREELERMEFRAFKAGISVGECFLAAALKKARKQKQQQLDKEVSHEPKSPDPNKAA